MPGRTVTILSSTYPGVSPPTSTTPRMIALDLPLNVSMLEADRTFTYSVTGNGRTSTCQTRGSQLECDITKLELQYATGYNLIVSRHFDSAKVGTAASVSVQTITPVSIMETSILPGAVVQDKPTQMSIKTDKRLTSIGSASVTTITGATRTPITATARLEDTAVIVTFGQELPRKTTFEVTLQGLRATDTSGLVGGAYTVSFATSGGPKVSGANIGNRNVSLSPSITLTFDQALHANQDLAPFIRLTANGAAVPISLIKSGNKLTLKPTVALPLCAKLVISVTGNVQNPAGVDGDSAWNMNSRTLCYTIFSIGSSVRGRTITAYRFGNGPSLIVYMGAMHGSEANSKQTMDEWFRELNNNPDRIPAHRSIVVIPSVNPDGVAAGTRVNANGVDINRNFPAFDWKSNVTMPGSSQVTSAGGPAPLSESESRAVASFIQQQQPRLVMSFHSKAAVVEANEAGDSVSIARSYASYARYRAVPKSQSTPIFQYDTTGAMEDWMRDRLGKPAIVVELATNTSSEFARNRSALWYTVGL